MDVPRRRSSPPEPSTGRQDGVRPAGAALERYRAPGWVTTVVRPAGRLDTADPGPLLALLDAAGAAGGALLLDLRATERLPAGVLRHLVDLDRRLAEAGGILLVLDPDARHDLPPGIVRDSGALEPVRPLVGG